jgi:hypothetical protein
LVYIWGYTPYFATISCTLERLLMILCILFLMECTCSSQNLIYFRCANNLIQCTILPRRVEGIYNLTRNIYKLNNVHKSNRQRHSNNNWNDFHIFQRRCGFSLFFFRLGTLGSIITTQGFGAIFGLFSTKCFKFYLYLCLSIKLKRYLYIKI